MGQFARELPDHGWDITVLTARYGAHSALDNRALAEVTARANIVATWSPASALVKRGIATHKHGVRALARRAARLAMATVIFPDREVFWVPGAIEAGLKCLTETRHDVVLASYGPGSSLMVGQTLAKRFKLPFVVDFRDLWSRLPMDVFATPLHRNAAVKLEHALVRKASRVIAVSPAMAEELAATHGLLPEHALSITNGFDPLDAERARDKRSTEAARAFRLVYTGTVHVHYDLAPLWAALRELERTGAITPDSFRVEFVGNLAPGDVRAEGVEAYVEINPFVPHAEVFDALAHADALLVVEAPGYYARYGYAAKVFDYVLTGKPIVALVDPGGNTHALLRDAGVGFFTEPGDTKGLVEVLRSVLTLKGKPPRSVSAEEAPLRQFNRRHLARTLARVLDEVVDSEPQGRW